MVGMTSSLCWIVCDRKLVSTRMEYGGAREVLNWKNIADGACGLVREHLVSYSVLLSAQATF